MVPFLFPASMDNNDLNPLERFVAKRELELELEHKAVGRMLSAAWKRLHRHRSWLSGTSGLPIARR